MKSFYNIHKGLTDMFGEPIADFAVQYGQEKGIENEWKTIIHEEDEDKRHLLIDALIERLESNSENNGFIPSSQKISCGPGSCFLLDDKQLYYSFFENLREIEKQESSKEISPTDGLIIHKAIQKTIKEYSGDFDASKVNLEAKLQEKLEKKGFSQADIDDAKLKLLRKNLTCVEMDDEGTLEAQSISSQKGRGTMLCTELAASCHNLWLLAGKTSYFCKTQRATFLGVGKSFQADAHNFTIVEYDGKYRLYDMAMGNYCMLESSCIDDVTSGKGLKAENVRHPGIYVVSTEGENE